MSKYIKLDDAIGIITEHQGIRGDTFKALHNADAVDIVRCRECEYWNTKDCREGVGECEWAYYMTKPDDFCSYGNRSEKPNNLSEIPTDSERSSE